MLDGFLENGSKTCALKGRFVFVLPLSRILARLCNGMCPTRILARFSNGMCPTLALWLDYPMECAPLTHSGWILQWHIILDE
jgi:hypothetical protein